MLVYLVILIWILLKNSQFDIENVIKKYKILNISKMYILISK